MAKKTQANQKETVAARRDRLNAMRAEAERKAARFRNIMISGAVALAVVIVAVFVVVAIQQGQVNQLQSSVTPKDAAPDNTGLYVYKENAKSDAVKVAVYFDYQCSACQSFETAVGGLLTDLAKSGDITLEYRMLYGTGGDTSRKANIMASCIDNSAGSEALVAFSQALFSNREDSTEALTDTDLTESVPADAGIDATALAAATSCYSQKLTNGFVQAMYDGSIKANVTATPTIVIGEKQYVVSDLTDMPTTDTAALLNWLKTKV
ncbi:MAG: DsbA family protein [Propionibacteriaceae bacterium]|jgi:protein-disulfide isomerase|nr:DsbA family protein [Propionibacteriaceae bacterium]